MGLIAKSASLPRRLLLLESALLGRWRRIRDLPRLESPEFRPDQVPPVRVTHVAQVAQVAQSLRLAWSCFEPGLVGERSPIQLAVGLAIHGGSPNHRPPQLPRSTPIVLYS